MRRTVLTAIARRDLVVAMRNSAVAVPMVALPLILTVFLPFVTWLISRSDLGDLPVGNLDQIIPQSARDASPDLPVQVAVTMSSFVFPTLLMIVPLMVVSVLTSDSFAGERERGSLEGMLLLPVDDKELITGKVLAAAVPAFLIHVVVSIVYAVAVDAVLWGPVGGPVLPTAGWLAIVLWAAPAVTALMLVIGVSVSVRASSVQAASQISAVIVLPVVALVVGQVGGVALLSGWVVLAFGAAALLAALVVARLGAAQLTRSRMSGDLPT